MTQPYEIIGDSADREAWLELRRTGIGGSDAPSILGLTSWASPASVQADKWGLLDEPDQAEILKWGQRLEPVILQALSEELENEIVPYGKLIRSTRHPFMICTPDGEGTECYYQVKNTMLASEWEDGPPKRVWVQCQHEMAVMDTTWMIAAALLFGNRLVWQEVERDDNFVNDVLIPAEKHFWDLTQQHEPVDPDGSPHTKRALLALYPEDSGETVTLDGSFTALDEARMTLLEQKKAVEKRLAEIDNELRAAIKDATYATLPNGVQYSLKATTRKAYEVKETTFRTLRRKKA